MPPSFNFPQLDFVEPSSGFHPVTWERVRGVGFFQFFFFFILECIGRGIRVFSFLYIEGGQEGEGVDIFFYKFIMGGFGLV